MRCGAITKATPLIAAHPCEHEREIRPTQVGARRVALCAFHRAGMQRGDLLTIRPR